MTDHTPLPWNLVKSVDGLITIDAIHYPEGVTAIADLAFNGRAARNNQVEANAAYIVQACNAHPALVAALEEVFGLLIERNPDFYTIGLDNRIRAALALARGEAPSA